MRLPAPALLVTLAASFAALPASSTAASKLSEKQIRAAVRRAESSRDLWATINVCDKASSKPRGDRLIGVRVQMPALGFATELFMSVVVEYWDTGQKRFLDTGTHFGPRAFSAATHLAHQGGVLFTFKPPAAHGTFLMRGRTTLEWRVGKRALGQVVRITGQGYKHVEGGNPAGFSASLCTITP